MAEREETHISEYNYLLKKLDSLLCIETPDISPTGVASAKTLKQFDEISEKTEEPTARDFEMDGIPSEPRVSCSLGSYSDLIKPCPGDEATDFCDAATTEEERGSTLEAEPTLRL